MSERGGTNGVGGGGGGAVDKLRTARSLLTSSSSGLFESAKSIITTVLNADRPTPADDGDDDAETADGGSASLDRGNQAVLARRYHKLKLVPLFFQRELGKPPEPPRVTKWRMKERMKTVSGALVLCLNLGVDPPDVIKTSPCARLECWFDPSSAPPQKAIDSIGKALQANYERWQGKARYKQCLDPTVEEVKKLCTTLRRGAKEDRVLFHYNGHGVPRPTSSGEIWVFNKNFTQYIPLSILELQGWLGSPSIYVFDASAAGAIVNWFMQFAQQREKDHERALATNPASVPTLLLKDCILLASCAANEVLPMNPDLPADLFTSCLLTPIRIALRWFHALNKHSMEKVTVDMLDKIPGKLTDRRTPLGELNWVFTAVTDTIAWTVLPPELFQKLFRQDLLVASLFRNYLLAERIMKSANCTTVSYPKLPSTHQHPMWKAWDLTLDICLTQLPELGDDPNAEFKQHSPFFAEQLTAFEVWLEFGTEMKKAPEQLPVVLQVLLSQSHRLRALVLLSRFLDLGPWAVNQALSVGIFPYVLKLLQSSAPELRQVLVSIWTKILALDKSCQVDLIKENGQLYFINILSASKIPSDQRTMAAFVLSVILNNCKQAQNACISTNLITACISHIRESDPMLRRWVVLCLAKFWEDFDDGKTRAVRENVHEHLLPLLTDPVAEVRAATLHALGLLFSGVPIDVHIGLSLPLASSDASPIVRKELIITLSKLINRFEEQFIEVAQEIMQQDMMQRKEDERKKLAAKKDRKKDGAPVPISTPATPIDCSPPANAGTAANRYHSGVFSALWRLINTLASDPMLELGQLAFAILEKINSKISARMQLLSSGNTDPSPRGESPQQYLTPSTLQHPVTPQSLRTSKSQSDVKLRQPPTTPTRNDLRTSNPNVMNRPFGETLEVSTEALLISTFYEQSSEYFTKPLQRKNNENMVFGEKLWIRQRNKAVIKEALTYKPNIKKFDDQVAIFNNDSEPAALMVFHPFETLVVVADDRDQIKVWNWEESSRVSAFRNGNPQGTRITAMTLANEHESAVLLTGADDGIIRAWKRFDKSDYSQMVTSWRAFNDFANRPRAAGLTFDWQQHRGMLATSGDVPVIRLWDMEKELAVQDILTNSESCVTSITNDKGFGNLVIAGFGDGSIRLFDTRIPTNYSLVMTYAEHNSWIINVAVPKFEFRIASGSVTGEVKFWDVRSPVSMNTIQHTSSMTAFSVHDWVPVIASGSQLQKIKVTNFSGEEISLIRYHDGFLGQRIGPVSSLTFHPYRLNLAAGAMDCIISIYEAPS